MTWVGGRVLEQCPEDRLCLSMPTHHFVPMDSVWCLVHGKFKLCFWELSEIFFSPNLFDLQLVESVITRPGGAKPADTERRLYYALGVEQKCRISVL